MQCVGSTHPAVQAYCRHAKLQCSPDEHHRCNLKACSYWQMPGVHGGVRYYVCKGSLHVHACTPHGCGLHRPSFNGLGADGAHYCELSGLQMKELDYVTLPVTRVTNQRSGAVSWVKTGVNLGGNRRRRAGKRKAIQELPHDAAKRTAHANAKVFTTAFVSTVALLIARTCKHDIRGTIKRVLRRTANKASFADVLHAVLLQCGVATLAAEPPAALTASVAEYAQRIFASLQPKPLTPIIVVATVLSLLQTGLACNGVVIFPEDPWVKANMPPLTAYGSVAGLQCRQMSVCTRAIKRLVFANGVVLPKFVFVQPNCTTNNTQAAPAAAWATQPSAALEAAAPPRLN